MNYLLSQRPVTRCTIWNFWSADSQAPLFKVNQGIVLLAINCELGNYHQVYVSFCVYLHVCW